MSRIPGPAVLALLGAGITPKSLADTLGVTPQAVSFQLAGKSAVTSPELLDAIKARGGPELADTIAELIAGERERSPRKRRTA